MKKPPPIPTVAMALLFEYGFTVDQIAGWFRISRSKVEAAIRVEIKIDK